MVKITNGKNTLIVPISAYNEYFQNTGWDVLKRKKKQVEENVEEDKTENIEEKNNKGKNKR